MVERDDPLQIGFELLAAEVALLAPGQLRAGPRREHRLQLPAVTALSAVELQLVTLTPPSSLHAAAPSRVTSSTQWSAHATRSSSGHMHDATSYHKLCQSAGFARRAVREKCQRACRTQKAEPASTLPRERRAGELRRLATSGLITRG